MTGLIHFLAGLIAGLLVGIPLGMLLQSVFAARVERRQREDPGHKPDSLD